MSFDLGLVRRRASLGLVALAFVGAACSSGDSHPAGSLAITSPVEGTTVTAADDLLPDLAGVQVEAVVAATNLEGATVVLKGPGSDSVNGVVTGGIARIPFTAGASGALVATATDANGSAVESAAVHVTFDPAPQACRFVSPADHAVLGAADDASPTDGFQAKVQVRCAGVELGNTVSLKVNGSAFAELPLGPGGSVIFPAVELAEGDDQLEATTATNAGAPVKASAQVTVKTGACRVVIAPPTGTVFNARGEGGHANVVADRTPGAPMDAVLVLTTGAECAGADLTVRRGQTPLATAKVTETTMELPVQLPDGTDEIRAYVSGKATGVSPLVRYAVDSVLPTATLAFPQGGETFSDSQDRSQAPGLQVPVRGKFSGIGAGKPFEVVLEPGTAQESVQKGVLAADESFDLLVTLANGSHTLLVRAARDSGTTAKTPQVSFTSNYVGASLAIVAPADGETFPLARDADPQADGYQVKFSIAGTNLAGASGTLHCGLAVSPFSLGQDGSTQVTVSFAGLPCEGARVECTARLQTAAGVDFTSAAVGILVDPTPPEVQLLTPAPDAIVPSNVVPVTATTSCAGETQHAAVLSGAVEVVAGDVAANTVSFTEVTLPGGESALVLRVADGAGNQTDVPFTVFVDADAPQPRFDSPSAADVQFGPQDDEQGDLNDGLQRTITVAVDNEVEGTLVELKVGDRAAASARTVADGAGHYLATFPAVSLPEGDSTLRACATDDAGSVGCTSLTVHVTTGRPTCTITVPGDGTALGHRDDLDPARDGVQADVLVETSAPVGSFASLVLAGPQGPQNIQVAVEAGTPNVARFPAVDFASEGSYTLQATCTGADNVTGTSLANTVKVDFTAPGIEVLDPTADEVFNLSSADRGASAGFQIDVRVRASEPAAGDLVKLTVSCGQGPQEIPAVAVNTQQEAVFRAVPLPDEASCDLTVQLEDGAGNLSPVVTTHVQVDRVAPVVSITAPNDGALYGAAKDADTSTPAFDLDKVTARIDGVPSSNHPTLQVGQTTAAQGSFSAISSTSVAATWAPVTLAEGANDLVVSATDEAGNTGTARVSVTVDTHGPVVAIANYVNGQVLNRSTDTDANTAGLQQNIRLTGEKLVDGTTVRLCSPQGTGTRACATGTGKVITETTLGGGSAVIAGVTLPEGALALYAEAMDQAGNLASSGTVNVVVDSVGPKVVSLGLAKVAAGGETALDTKNGTAVFGQADDSGSAAGFQARLKAQLSGIEAGKGLVASFYTSNPSPGTLLGTAPIAADGTVSLDVTLGEGGHRISVLARDAAGNATSTPENPVPGETPVTLNFGVDVTAPSLAFLAPTAGKLLAKDDRDAAAGLQFDLDIASDAGAGQAIAVTLDGAAFGSALLPAAGSRATLRVTIPEGAHALAASVKDLAGNSTQSAAVNVFVDSVAPVVAITAPANGATLSTDGDPATDGFQISVTLTYGQVEAGQTLVLASSTGGTLGQVVTDASGSATFAGITVPAGAQALTATVADASGNVTTSVPVNVTIDTNAPSIRFVASANPLYFGLSDGVSTDGKSCTPAIQATCDIDGSTAVLLVNGVAGSPVTVASNAASFPALSIPAGQSVTLQLKATDSQGRIGYSATRQATCDLGVPAVTVQAPATSAVSYVAYGNPGQVAGAIADKLPGAPLDADFTVLVTGANGGTVSVKSSIDGVLATQNVTSDPFTATFSNVQVFSQGRHTLTISAATRSKNTKDATVTADVDVVAPSAVTPSTAIASGTRTSVVLSFPAPGDDAAAGAKVAGYVVKRSDGAIDDLTKWANATTVTPSGLTVASPGAQQQITVTSQPFESQWFYAVRALDAAGNLAALGTSAAADLRSSRLHLSVPVAAGYTQAREVMADLDGDGRDDLVAGASGFNSNQGQVFVYYGAATPGTAVALTVAGNQHFGSSIAAGDVNGDGLADLLVAADLATAPGSAAGAHDGAVYVFLGHQGTRFTSSSTADAVLYGKVAVSDNPTGIGGGIGYELAVVGDVDGDGKNDLAVTSRLENASRGRVLVFGGRATWPATLQATDALADITTNNALPSGPQLGWKVAAPGDLNGDGFAEIALSAPFGNATADANGLIASRPVYLLSGKLVRGQVVAEQVSAAAYVVDQATRVNASSRYGFDLVASDVTGDGKKDLVVIDSLDGRINVLSGALLAAFVPTAAVTSMQDASSAKVATTVGPYATGGGVPVLRTLGDVTGDGIDDFYTVLVGTTSTNLPLVLYGRASWPTGTVPFDTSIARVDTTKEFGSFGVRAAGGHFVSTTVRDIVLLDLGGTATVLTGP